MSFKPYRDGEVVDALHVATRKGLMTYRKSGGAWTLADTQFLGDPVSSVIVDPRYGAIYAALNRLVWANSGVTAERWMVVAAVMLFSLIVGLAQKYLRAPTVINGGFAESMKGEGPQADYRTFPGALLTSFASLLSGASVGPEGPVTVLVQNIAAWVRTSYIVQPNTARVSTRVMGDTVLRELEKAA